MNFDELNRHKAVIEEFVKSLDTLMAIAISKDLPFRVLLDLLMSAVAGAAAKLDDDALNKWIDRAPVELGILIHLNRGASASLEAALAIEAAKKAHQ